MTLYFVSAGLMPSPLVNPLLAIFVVLFVGLVLSNTFEGDLIELCLYASFAALYFGLYSCLFFNQGVAGFQFVCFLHLSSFGTDFMLGVDGISMVFLLLTLFIFPFCFLAARSVSPTNIRQFCGYLLAMEILLVLTFTTMDLFYFYVFFESLLIPMFILIGV